MQIREKLEERRYFTTEEKIFIGQKSLNRCSHCGKKLTTDFTVEHVIPLNKGGTNDLTNLVALCSSCNVEKSDFVCHPKDYYNFLLPEYIDELIKNQLTYYSEYSYLTPNTLLPEDIREFKVEIIPEKVASFSTVNKKFNKAYNYRRISSIFLKRAIYSDLDSLYKYTFDFMNSISNEFDEVNIKKECKDMLSNWFDNGCIYFLVDKVNEIKGIIPVSFDGFALDKCLGVSENKKDDGAIPFFHSPVIKKDSMNHAVVLIKVYTYILSNLTRLLKRPIYFGASVEYFRKCSICAFDYLCKICDYSHGFDDYTGFGSQESTTFYGKWSETSEMFMENVQSIETVPEFRNDLEYINKYSSVDHLLGKRDEWVCGSFDIAQDIIAMRVFAKSLAKQLGLILDVHNPESVYSSIPIEEKYEVITLPIKDIILPTSIPKDITIPTFIKQQVKSGNIRHVRIDASNVINKEDVPILNYLKQLNKKTIVCDRRRDEMSYTVEKFTSSSGGSSAMFERVKALDGSLKDSVPLEIISQQDCKCIICGIEFNHSILPYTILKKSAALGGKKEYDNILASCKRCKKMVGILSYSEGLRQVILEEIKQMQG